MELLVLRLNFVFCYNFLLLKLNCFKETCEVLRGYEIMFLESAENVWSSERCVSPLTNMPLHPLVIRDQAI